MDLKLTTLSSPNPLEQIGCGDCGSVWGTLWSSDATCSRTPIVIKRENALPGRDIKNEVFVQSRVCVITLWHSSVPLCLGFMDKNDPRWCQIVPLMPRGFGGCRAMISEKIEPVSLGAQKLLIERFAPEESREELEKSLGNGKGQHCLVRIYLGRRRQKRRPDLRSFSLRSYFLNASQAEDLKLPCAAYAMAMGEALATLHWKIRTDGADVEFVLGARRGYGSRDSATPLEQHALWMLDFDCSRPIEANESGLESIARAFWRNDPYYPRPNSPNEHDQQLWNIFAFEYQRVGMKIVRTCPREGEDVEALCTLVEGALTKIVETKKKWKDAGRIKSSGCTSRGSHASNWRV